MLVYINEIVSQYRSDRYFSGLDCQGRFNLMPNNGAFNEWREKTDYAWLLQPLSTDLFERKFYERKFCLVSRAQHDYYQKLLSITKLDDVIGSQVAKFPDVRLVQGDRDIDASAYSNSSGTVDPLQLAKHFENGATLVFQGLHRIVPALSHIGAVVGRHFASRVQANAYLTPSDSQGFRPHWDTHDVFVLQVSGRKRWFIYDSPVNLPLRGQKCDPDVDTPGELLEEFELEAGSCLYLPRGVMHSAHSTDATSLHITLGLLGFTWADFLTEFVAASALNHVTLREHLPIGFAGPNIPLKQRQELIREKLADLATNLDSHDVWKHFATEVVSNNRPVFNDLLQSRLCSPSLVLGSLVRRRSEVLACSAPDENRYLLRFCGQEVSLPIEVAEAADFISRKNGEFEVQDLPDCLDSEGKLLLIRRLVVEGLLELC